MSPHLQSSKLFGFTGTGFAQPKISPDPDTRRPMGMMIDPHKSRCGKGLRVIRPARSAVSSPSIRATKAWATS